MVRSEMLRRVGEYPMKHAPLPSDRFEREESVNEGPKKFEVIHFRMADDEIEGCDEIESHLESDPAVRRWKGKVGRSGVLRYAIAVAARQLRDLADKAEG